MAKTRKKPSSRSSTWGKKGGESDRSKTPKAVAPCVRTTYYKQEVKMGKKESRVFVSAREEEKTAQARS